MLTRQLTRYLPGASKTLVCSPSPLLSSSLYQSSAWSTLSHQLLSSAHKETSTSLQLCMQVGSSFSRHRLLMFLSQHAQFFSDAKGSEPGKGVETPRIRVDNLVTQSHIRGLAEKLGCRVTEMKSLILDYTFLIHMDLDLVESKIDLLASYDLPVTFVRQHLRLIYQTSNAELKRRLQIIKDAGLLHSPFLEKDKLAHLLESRKSEFDRGLKYRCDQRDALEGCEDQLSYLQMRLACSDKTARGMLHSYPLERRVSNVKLKTLLDFFLVEAQRSPDFVTSHRKLLAFSVERLRRRWDVIQRAGVDLEDRMVIVWSISEKDFENEYREYLCPAEGDAKASPAS